MSILRSAALAAATGGLCAGLTLGAAAQEFNDKPLQENWWPTEWGPDDKAGSRLEGSRRAAQCAMAAGLLLGSPGRR